MTHVPYNPFTYGTWELEGEENGVAYHRLVTAYNLVTFTLFDI